MDNHSRTLVCHNQVLISAATAAAAAADGQPLPVVGLPQPSTISAATAAAAADGQPLPVVGLPRHRGQRPEGALHAVAMPPCRR